MKKKYYFCKIFVALKKRRTLMFFTSACIILLSACNNSLSMENESVKTPNKRLIQTIMEPSEFPATSAEILAQKLDEDIRMLCPFTANVVATYELQNGKYKMFQRLKAGTMYDENQLEECHVDINEERNWYLTELPRMILNYDGSVKYYEYGLVEDGEVTGIITVYAKREAPCAIAYMFPYVLPYNNAEYDYYVGEYPCRVFNDGVGYRAVEDCAGELIYQSNASHEFWDMVNSQLEIEDYNQLEELLARTNQPDLQMEEEAATYWNAVDDIISNTNQDTGIDHCMIREVTFGGGESETYVINTYVENLQTYLGTNEYCFSYTARPYCNTQLQQTFWKCACGPAALAWIYRGLYTDYPITQGSSYLPVNGDGNQNYFQDNYPFFSLYYFDLETLNSLAWTLAVASYVKTEYIDRSFAVDNGLTAIGYSYSIPVKASNVWQFLVLPWYLDNAFSSATNNIYSIARDCSALTAANHIHTNDLPVILLQSNLQHYLVAYGYGGVVTPGEDIERKNLYFLVMDNGYTISDHYYKPYWRAYKSCEYYHRVMRN